ncbi:MAG TPA: ribonuclease HII [Candidatus Omnitrophota bacterium]|nr:ribonuclease HII [Candidatus Omnitrophota bacterium]
MPRKRIEKVFPDRLVHERKAFEEGFLRVAGIDEAGRGPLAGPVVAAAVVIRDASFRERIDDSKKMSPGMRERSYIEILERCEVGLGVVGPETIDKINIFQATLMAMRMAVEELKPDPEYLLIDGKMPVDTLHARTYLFRGEEKSLSIAAASIVAKVTRDRIMLDEDRKYPVYGFSQHKGYGTKAHIEAIRMNGFSPIHRKTFGPFGG